MSIIKSIQFGVSSGREFLMQGVDLSDVLAIKRNGIGLKFSGPVSESAPNEVVQAFSYESLSTKSFVPNAGVSFVKVNSVVLPFGISRQEIFLVGDGIQPGVIYNLYGIGITVSYTSTISDTQASITNALASLVNAEAYAVTASVSGTYLVLSISDTDEIFSSFLSALNFYQSGVYCNYNGSEYLISGSSSYSSMPPIPSLLTSYDSDDLTLLPNGLIDYLQDPTYVQQRLITEALGFTFITNITTITSLYPTDGNTVYVYAGIGRVAEEFTDEYITILYK